MASQAGLMPTYRLKSSDKVIVARIATIDDSIAAALGEGRNSMMTH